MQSCREHYITSKFVQNFVAVACSVAKMRRRLSPPPPQKKRKRKKAGQTSKEPGLHRVKGKCSRCLL